MSLRANKCIVPSIQYLHTFHCWSQAPFHTDRIWAIPSSYVSPVRVRNFRHIIKLFYRCVRVASQCFPSPQQPVNVTINLAHNLRTTQELEPPALRLRDGMLKPLDNRGSFSNLTNYIKKCVRNSQSFNFLILLVLETMYLHNSVCPIEASTFITVFSDDAVHMPPCFYKDHTY